MQLDVEVSGIELLRTSTTETVNLMIACITYAAKQQGTDPSESASVAVKLTTDSETIQLHDEFFQVPCVTDVMTFPSGEKDKGSGVFHLGDIAICHSVAVEHSREQGHSLTRELVFLSLHGLLHLLGYGDQSQKDREIMLELQEELIISFEDFSGRSLP